MFPESLLVVLFQTFIQGLLAFVIMVILRKFYRQYHNDYFQYWSWSWLALTVNMLGSALSLANVFLFPLDHPFRILVSILTVSASFLQIIWLFTGSYELSKEKKISKNWAWSSALLILPLSIILVFLCYDDPEAGSYRILFRVGIKALAGGAVFIVSSLLLIRRSRSGIGVKFIIFAFCLYGILQFNTFSNQLFDVIGYTYHFKIPFYASGAIELFLQALMGLGMIISVLEIEQDNLKKANTELDTFLYRSSHDLRAPLTTISGIVEVLKIEKDKAKMPQYLQLINERVEQADNVIKDIITLRKGQKLGLNLKMLNVREEVEKEYDMLKSPVKEMPELLIEVEGDQTINTDYERLHTVLTNILSNGIKYHKYGQKIPWIKVKSLRTDEGVILTISDNGPGIEEKHLVRIFEMFYRANKSSTGSGLGLYLVKDALDVMKGSIEVNSVKDIGTDFKIFIRDLGGKSV